MHGSGYSDMALHDEMIEFFWGLLPEESNAAQLFRSHVAIVEPQHALVLPTQPSSASLLGCLSPVSTALKNCRRWTQDKDRAIDTNHGLSHERDDDRDEHDSLDSYVLDLPMEYDVDNEETFQNWSATDLLGYVLDPDPSAENLSLRKQHMKWIVLHLQRHYQAVSKIKCIDPQMQIQTQPLNILPLFTRQESQQLLEFCVCTLQSNKSSLHRNALRIMQWLAYSSPIDLFHSVIESIWHGLACCFRDIVPVETQELAMDLITQICKNIVDSDALQMVVFAYHTIIYLIATSWAFFLFHFLVSSTFAYMYISKFKREALRSLVYLAILVESTDFLSKHKRIHHIANVMMNHSHFKNWITSQQKLFSL
ncbi:hypothetical protein RFI_01535 [Reticulomyxa filosa]|uniref:Uncharacterized protein n=1 Tax=Reticulomyxa filosa TaxID=46433 RepID=X6PBU4_RETFI|nr:hypothetical protein RFI_01535 [Reticulomyxa filosa]|eukprot:ETO35529.1 hypothetical protein RFI_01535 [Reticulomyxa filosa]